MTAAIALRIADDASEFFEPIDPDFVAAMIQEYTSSVAAIDRVVSIFDGDLAAVIGYFIDGNSDENSRGVAPDRLFKRAGAIASLNADCWSRLLEKTDVLDCMPQKRRDEWHELIRKRAAPDFEESTVKATLADMLGSRAKFFAERVSGLFQSLSGNHVTNSPRGFSERMIVEHMFDRFGYVDHSRVGYIHDLRIVVAKFMGRDEPVRGMTWEQAKLAREQHGEWLVLDGGALRMRAYLKGTAHLEVNEELAWRLNCVLHSIHPNAIASKDRKKPSKRSKEFVMMGRPLPFAVLSVIAGMERLRDHKETEGRIMFRLPYGSWDRSKHITEEVGRVLESIGACRLPAAGRPFDVFEFDFEPKSALDLIVASGCIPDRQAHQYYPTPRRIAEAAIELAEIGSNHSCLEPSAGQGGLACLMPDDTLCIEISELHCDILRARGFYKVICGDFLDVRTLGCYSRIVMNPPFGEGRWRLHLERAASLLADGGRLVAILPASARGQQVLANSWTLRWSEVFENEFVGTSISVVILVAEMAAPTKGKK